MKVIVFVPAKGGVGKTTLTAGATIAALLANPETRVGIVDLGCQGR